MRQRGSFKSLLYTGVAVLLVIMLGIKGALLMGPELLLSSFPVSTFLLSTSIAVELISCALRSLEQQAC